MCCTRSSKFDLMHLQLHSLNKRSSNFGVRKHFSPCVSFLLLLLLLCSIRFVSFLHMCILFFPSFDFTAMNMNICVYNLFYLCFDHRSNWLKRHAVRCCLARILRMPGAHNAVFCVYVFKPLISISMSSKWNGCLVINYLLYDFENWNGNRKRIFYIAIR